MSDDPFFVRAENEFYDRSRTVARVVRVLRKQTGKTSIPEDRKVSSMRPGKRISKNGKIYWETRKNRSDIIPKNKL
jgi:hypothetical protein